MAAEDLADDDDLRLLIEATPDYAIYLLDPDGQIRTWNLGAQRLKGYQAEEVIGRNFALFYAPDAVKHGQPRQALDIARQTGRFTQEGWRIRKDGSRFWALVTLTALRHEDGTLRGFGKVTRDLSERKRHEDALRRAEEHLRLAFEGAPTGIALVSLTGEFIRVNAALSSILGLTPDDLRAHRLPDVLPMTVAGPSAEPTEQSLAEQGPVDTQVTRPDGTRIWVQVNARLVRDDDDGAASQIVVQVEDVSTRVAANEALQDAEQAKSRFVAITSHELRSPLTSILGFSSMLEQRWHQLDDDARRDAIGRVAQQARRLRLLVEDLLTLSSLEGGELILQRQRLDLLDVVQDVAGSLNLPVTAEVAPGITAELDPMRLTQLLTNLLVNATKYGRPPFVVTVAASGDSIEIAVRDHGDGVDADFAPRMFDRFTQADGGMRRRSQGTGLGLAICRTLAEAHQGSIRYESAEGGGAKFIVSLPSTAPAESDALPA